MLNLEVLDGRFKLLTHRFHSLSVMSFWVKESMVFRLLRTEGRFKAGFKVYMQQREVWLEQWWLALSGGNSSEPPNQRLVAEVRKEQGMVKFESFVFSVCNVSSLMSAMKR